LKLLRHKHGLVDILSIFPAKIATFPGKYLGLPLHYRHLHKVHLQPLIDKIATKLPGWMGKNLARPGRITLARTVLMAIAVYHATVIPLSKWARHKIIKIARRFVWARDAGEHDAREHALVNWKTVCRPKDLGGLGIPDLDRSSRALHLCWLWLQWTDPPRSWSGSKLPCDNADRDLFRACDEVLTRQCPCLGLSIHGAYVGAWRIRRLQTETGVHTNLPRFGPPEGKDLHPACLILYCLYSWSCYNDAQMGSGYG
jgi:hypothetical protein